MDEVEKNLGELDLYLTYDGHLSGKDIDNIFSSPITKACGECRGSGTNYNNFRDCPTCNGEGKVSRTFKELAEDYLK